jgi:hypothetical protein
LKTIPFEQALNRLPSGIQKRALARYHELRPSVEEIAMPAISMFYGIIISMYFLDNRQHKSPHIHVRYQDDEAVYSIPDGELLAGSIPTAKARMVQAWIEIHRDELMADWQLAVSGQQPFRIDPLK